MAPVLDETIVAGHVCLDVIVELDSDVSELDALLTPGKLLEVGPALIAPGGAVSNTGLALHRLGLPTRLMGKIGKDLHGRAILEALANRDEGLAGNMIVAEDEHSSYTLVLSSRRFDRIFLHCPGANDTFRAADVPIDLLKGARLFHFGYPPLMQAVYADGGEELATLFRGVSEQGLVVSLDMAKPDPESEAGRLDWRAWLTTVLPHVDIFLPSLDEILFMLDRVKYEQLARAAGSENLLTLVDGELLSEIATQLLSMGAAVVVLKLGEEGLYLRTTSDPERLSRLPSNGLAEIDNWLDVELLRPCFSVDVAGTTGAGDCSIAGFLSAVMMQNKPEDALTNAVAVGAFSVEAADATSGVPSQAAVQERVRGSWEQRHVSIDLPNWHWDSQMRIWRGPGTKSEIVAEL